MGQGMSKGSEGELPTDEEEPTSGSANSEFYSLSSSSSAYLSPRIDSLRASRIAHKSAVEFEIAASKSHWTHMDSDEEPACSPKDNLKYFESLMLNFRSHMDSDEEPACSPEVNLEYCESLMLNFRTQLDSDEEPACSPEVHLNLRTQLDSDEEPACSPEVHLNLRTQLNSDEKPACSPENDLNLRTQLDSDEEPACSPEDNLKDFQSLMLNFRTQLDSDEEPACSPEDNLKDFQSLMLNFRGGRERGWPHHAYFEKPNMLVGNKIAEGGQAEIYEVTFPDGDTVPLVLKVFKEGHSVRSLARQWPPGMIEFWKRHKGNERTLLPSPFFYLEGAVLLNDERFHNRFAFVMRRAWGDLRKHIDERMLNRQHKQAGPPYSTEETLILMWAIAQDMFWLHGQGILHRDLKASNVLVWVDSTCSEVERFEGKVSDFECSVGVLGTGFWRAPEILQQLKDEQMKAKPKVVFTTKADVYSFGMTCYEIVTGCTPFEGVLCQDYDHVLRGNQPVLPEDLDPLIGGCQSGGFGSGFRSGDSGDFFKLNRCPCMGPQGFQVPGFQIS